MSAGEERVYPDRRLSVSDLLLAVAGALTSARYESVTWRRCSRGIEFRLWETEHTYLLVTKQARALVLRGLVRREMAAGYAYVERGPVELTPEGVTELQRLAVAP